MTPQWDSGEPGREAGSFVSTSCCLSWARSGSPSTPDLQIEALSVRGLWSQTGLPASAICCVILEKPPNPSDPRVLYLY